jgi:hypothetical protein
MRLELSNLVSWAVMLSSAALAAFAVRRLGLRRRDGGPRAAAPAARRTTPARRALWSLAAVLGIAVALISLFGALDDGLATSLAKEPATGLMYPRGHLYDTLRTGSAFRAGAYVERVYGITDSNAQVDAFFGAELGRLGYVAVAPTPGSEAVKPTLHPPGMHEYRKGRVRFLTWTAPSPRQVGGRSGPVIGAPFTRVLWTRITNAPAGTGVRG